MSKLVEEYKGPGVLPLREQCRVVNDILLHRFDTVLPMAMRDAGIDMWILICNEDNYDPVFKTMLPWQLPWTPILQIVVLYDKGKRAGVERLNVAFTNMLGMMTPAWTLADKDDQWKTLRRIVRDRNPKRIGINISDVIWAADGLTVTLHNKLLKALGARFSKQLVPAEKAAIRWLETRTERELDLYETVAGVAHGIIRSCYSREAITPAATTLDDLDWRFWQTVHDLGAEPSFRPRFRIFRSSKESEQWGKGDRVIRYGDMLHCDVGISYLRMLTDMQELAYVRRPGETEAPQGLRDGLAWSNKLQDVCARVWGQSLGLTGNEILKRSLREARNQGIPSPKVYSHSLSHYLHEPGPLIGLPWEQRNTGARGDVILNYNTCYTMELLTRCAVPEWGGQELVFPLEQDVAFTKKGIRFLDGRQTAFHLI